MSPKKIVGALMVLATMLLGGCRITLTPIVSLSSLMDTTVRTAPVVVTANVEQCDQEFLDSTAEFFKASYVLRPAACKKKGKKYEASWDAEIPLLRAGDEKKIPHVPVSIYYSKNHTVILTLKVDFLNDLTDKIKEMGTDLASNELYIALIFKNDTNKPVNIAVENVFVNEVPVGRDMAIFKIKAGGSILVRLSDLTTNSLMLGGIEAAGVFPALEPNMDSESE